MRDHVWSDGRYQEFIKRRFIMVLAHSAVRQCSAALATSHLQTKLQSCGGGN